MRIEVPQAPFDLRLVDESSRSSLNYSHIKSLAPEVQGIWVEPREQAKKAKISRPIIDLV